MEPTTKAPEIDGLITQQSDWEDYLEARWPVHYIGTVEGACWMPSYDFFAKGGVPQYRQDREDSMLFVLPIRLEQCYEPVDYSGPDPRESYSMGKVSDWSMQGSQIVRVNASKFALNPNSKLAQLFELLRTEQRSLLEELKHRGHQNDASIWEGLRLEIRHQRVAREPFTLPDGRVIDSIEIAVPSLASVPVTAAAASAPVAGVQESGAAVDPPVGPAAPSAHGPYVLTTTGETIEVPVPMALMEEIARVTAGVSDQQAVLTHLNRADGPYRTNSALMIWAFQSEDFWALLADLQASR